MATLLQTIDTAHEDMIHDAQMDYYGVRLATCSSDRSVKVFDIRNGAQKLVADLKGHDGPVWQIAWAHPMFGTVLASCSYDRKVILWKETDGVWSKLEEFKNHDSSVNSICWAPHEFGLMLACGSSDGAVSIMSTSGDGSWESQKINNAHTIGCNAVSWAPAQTKTTAEISAEDPKALKRFVTGGCDNLVKIWKFSEAESKWVEEHKLEAHSDWVRDVAWAPSPGLEAQSTIASCSQDRRVILWTSTNLTSWNFQVLSTFDDVIWHVSWSVTGNILAVSGGDNKVTLWKESVDNKWVCISDDAKSQNAPAAAVGSAERNL